jgi:Family of unknown function (DUF6299)
MLAMALVPFAAGPAMAAPPANDVPGGALAVSMGDTATQDTTEATTDADDAAFNENCGAPETGASVWYTFTPDADAKVVFDTSESSYETGLMIFKGTPTPDSLRACGPVGLGLKAHAGKTYYVMAFNDNALTGGDLVLTVTKAPTPKVHVTLDKHGVAFHTGAAKIHGTYSCKHDESFSGLNTHIIQRAGRLKIQATRGIGTLCDGQRHRWSAKLVSPVGTYARGPAVAKAQVFACGLLECRQAKVEGHVSLSWAKGPHRQQAAKPTTGLTARPHARFGSQKYWPHR